MKISIFFSDCTLTLNEIFLYPWYHFLWGGVWRQFGAHQYAGLCICVSCRVKNSVWVQTSMAASATAPMESTQCTLWASDEQGQGWKVFFFFFFKEQEAGAWRSEWQEGIWQTLLANTHEYTYVRHNHPLIRLPRACPRRCSGPQAVPGAKDFTGLWSIKSGRGEPNWRLGKCTMCVFVCVPSYVHVCVYIWEP